MRYRTPDWTEEDWRNSYQEAIKEFLAKELLSLFRSKGFNTVQTDQCISLSEYRGSMVDLIVNNEKRRTHIGKCAFCMMLWNHRIFIDNPPE